MSKTLSKDLGRDPFVMVGRNWNRDLKEEGKMSERRGGDIRAYPDLARLEDEGTHRDRCHDFDGCRQRSERGAEERRGGMGMVVVES